MKVKSETEAAQSCLTVCDPMDCSLPGSSIHGIFQARVLEWSAIAFSIKRSYILSKLLFNLLLDPPGGKIAWRRVWQPTPVFVPGEAPWTEEPDGLQLDMTE